MARALDLRSRGCPGQVVHTHYYYHRLTQLKDVSVSTIPGALSALEALRDYALYNLHLHYMTLHYSCACVTRQCNLVLKIFYSP